MGSLAAFPRTPLPDWCARGKLRELTDASVWIDPGAGFPAQGFGAEAL